MPGCLFALGVFLTVAAPSVAGQDITPGARAGLSFMTHGGEDAAAELERRTGMVIGGFATVDFTGPFALRSELVYVQKGATRIQNVEGTRITSSLRMNYLELPVLGRYHPPITVGQVSPTLHAGPVLGYNVWATIEDKGFGQSTITDVRDQVRTMEVGLSIGGGVDVPFRNGTVSLDLRYEVGLTSFSEGDAVRNQGIILTAGFAFEVWE